MSDTLRLFVGIDIGEDWTDRLSATADDLHESLGRAVRWVRPELYHVTVVFLGDQPPEAIDKIAEALASAAESAAPFELRLTSLRRLGGHERGALVAGVDDPTGSLQRLRAHLDGELHQRDIAFDSKPLVPHVTLGRPRGRGGPLPVSAVDLSDVPPLTVASVNLVKSDLQTSGPRYETISIARLG
jgi:2'-5' RNA ligase